MVGRALDCVGVVVVAAAAGGAALEDSFVYSATNPQADDLTRQLAAQLDKISLDDCEPGDVVQIAFPSRSPTHLAVVVGWARMVHALPHRGCCISSTMGAFGRRIVAAWRLR